MPLNAVQLGRDSIIGFTEVTQTTRLAGTGPAEQLFTDSFSFTREHAEVIVEEITGARSLRRRVQTDVTCNGSFTKSVDPYNGIGLYRHLLTGSITSASQGSGTFLHTFSEGDELPQRERLQFMISEGGNSATSRDWTNGVVESYSLQCGKAGLAKETWSLKFNEHSVALNTAPAIALTFVDPIIGNRTQLRLGTTITTVSIVATRDFTLNFANNIEENREIATNTVQNFTFGVRAITGTFNIIFDSLTMYNNFYNNTSLAMQINLEHPDATSGTNHYVRINLPQIHFNGGNPEVSGLGQIIQPVNFTAIYGSNATYQAQITVFNSTSTVPT